MMNENATRLEYDLAGSMPVPRQAYYGIHSLRAAENFPITGQRLPKALIENLACIKKSCALANADAGSISPSQARAICQACDEILAGKWHDQFIVDPIQGGAGTSTNMNANEVIANRAIELMGGTLGDYSLIHPNDHVNCAQSTNDVYPTAIRMTLYHAIEPLMEALDALVEALDEKATAFDSVITLGRTQLQDAVPIRYGQIFSAYASVMRREKERIRLAQQEMLCINLGGTAVGTGITASPVYLEKVVSLLAAHSRLPLYRSTDCVDATQNADSYVALSSALKSCGSSLSKICNDLRLLSSGPHGGLGELILPARQNGSSIMPGKINPVIPEVVNQIAFRLIGFDMTVTMAAEAGQLELNAFEPMIFDSLYQGCCQLCQGIRTLTMHCIQGIEVNQAHCRMLVEHSSSLATAIIPRIGYTQACHLAREAQKNHTTIREAALEKELLTQQESEFLLDPQTMTECLIPIYAEV